MISGSSKFHLVLTSIPVTRILVKVCCSWLVEIVHEVEGEGAEDEQEETNFHQDNTERHSCESRGSTGSLISHWGWWSFWFCFNTKFNNVRSLFLIYFSLFLFYSILKVSEKYFHYLYILRHHTTVGRPGIK